MIHEIETCAVCGVEHQMVGGQPEPCPYGVTDVCPICAEIECTCDFFQALEEGISMPEDLEITWSEVGE